MYCLYVINFELRVVDWEVVFRIFFLWIFINEIYNVVYGGIIVIIDVSGRKFYGELEI